MNAGRRRGRARRWEFRVGAVLVVVVVLIAVETGLRLFNPGIVERARTEKTNPAGAPYFEVRREDGREIYTQSRYYQPWGHRFRFEMPKPKGVYRIFVLGDSTANGQVFTNRGAFAKWLAVMVAAVDPWREYEVINAGQSGFPAMELLALERQVVEAAPDLVIIYASNNEFFYRRGRVKWERQSAGSAWLKYWSNRVMLVSVARLAVHARLTGVAQFEFQPEAMRAHGADHIRRELESANDREIKEDVLRDYRSDLSEMVALARDRGAAVILCTIPVNTRDWEPSGSYHRAGLEGASLERWRDLVQAGTERFSRGELESARAAFLAAEAIDDEPAELAFYLGHCLLQLGDTDGAWDYFQRALEKDPVQSRAARDLNQIIRETATAQSVRLADVVPAFRAKAPTTVPGDDLFIDYVHPTLEGQRLIAETILQTMISADIVPGPRRWRRDAGQAADAYQAQMPREYLFNSYHTTASLDAFLGRFVKARRWENKALEYDPGAGPGLQLKQCLDLIYIDYAKQYNTGLPWGEFEFARRGPDQRGTEEEYQDANQ